MITIEATAPVSPERAWELWIGPEHIMQWNQASPDWECPAAENDVRVGGAFKSTMAAKDGSRKFDFTGVYTVVEPFTHLAYTLDDGRKADIAFTPTDAGTHIVVSFDPENENPEEMQRAGWQAILNSYVQYCATTKTD